MNISSHYSRMSVSTDGSITRAAVCVGPPLFAIPPPAPKKAETAFTFSPVDSTSVSIYIWKQLKRKTTCRKREKNFYFHLCPNKRKKINKTRINRLPYQYASLRFARGIWNTPSLPSPPEPAKVFFSPETKYHRYLPRKYRVFSYKLCKKCFSAACVLVCVKGACAGAGLHCVALALRLSPSLVFIRSSVLYQTVHATGLDAPCAHRRRRSRGVASPNKGL